MKPRKADFMKALAEVCDGTYPSDLMKLCNLPRERCVEIINLGVYALTHEEEPPVRDAL